ncbi:MAG TPA: DegT/DnrJ/EryC1/StrS family aminotransferase [Anaerolineaceae bacterium]|nr:DegT/DnrJ/EryC1/StrS family aminotransferase [Anaerolineaceae bacterium]HPN51415.1 DegT/DnrJ/EryC1/StrS family aminotransferase [Anaerolineaceae bacterium]
MSDLAITGGTPVRSRPFPAWPEVDDRDLEAVAEVIRSRQWSGQPYPGPKAAELGWKMAEMQMAGYGLALANGTVTVEVALRAAHIGWGAEVIVPAYTDPAVASAVVMAGALPVLADIDLRHYCIDPAAVEAAITPDTRALVVSHMGAQMADMDAIVALCTRHQLTLIEDCTHATGGRWLSRGAGSFGQFGCFSLGQKSPLPAAEGGVLLCWQPEMLAAVTSIADGGQPQDAEKLNWTFGGNYRMSEVHAALGLTALLRFPEQLLRREAMVSQLERALADLPGVTLPLHDERHTTRSFYRYIFTIQSETFGAPLARICAALQAEGIPCSAGPEPLHRHPRFQPRLSHLPAAALLAERFDYSKAAFPAAEKVAREALWLDERVFRSGPKGIQDVVNAVHKVQEHASEL